MTEKPGQRRVSDSCLVTEIEKQQLLSAASHTKPAELENSSMRCLLNRCSSRPEAVAVQGEGWRLTYKEVEHRSNQLAAYLRQQGIGADARVGVFLEGTADLVIVLLATWQSRRRLRAPFCPLTDFPIVRVRSA